ncbi:NYN domain-containing protein [Aggregatibacter kilianii]|uniref:NYN domain-containing protein n=1 Tax=Aggregatibacter kilianii TaxID=2025884 RepID=UPI000D6516B1|nr:NYN domain-containing protein [Aggregatibacter kilianii]
MELEKTTKLAVLIDADNVQPKVIEAVFEEIAKYGVASVKRIYGDWSDEALNKKWKDLLLPNAIIPMHQLSYTKKKNSTDISMVIDAMDLLHSGIFDGFCIVSSDSDFTRLALRIRESGAMVYGFGEEKTPEAFRKACHKFIYVENLQLANVDIEETISSEQEKSVKTDDAKDSVNRERLPVNKLKQDTALMNLIRSAIAEYANNDGWAYLGSMVQYMTKVRSDFDSRTYGYAKVSALISAIDLFETKIQGSKFLVKNKKSK